ncbi:MAG: hypothetical protein F4Z05_13430 [Chloroflexi bacterium]|nr:hypothetical protein [Chloroflexota bacterium]
MRDAFLLGAGFSQAVHEEMPTMDELFRKLKPLVGVENGVDPDVYEYACKSGKVETLLTYYAIPSPSDDHIAVLRKRVVAARLEQSIGLVLACRERHLNRLAHCTNLGQKLVNRWDEQGSHVLTANYDTLVEQLSGYLDDAQVPILYPITVVPLEASTRPIPAAHPEIPVLQLYKLHGSVSWYTSQDKSNSDPIYGFVDFGPPPFTPPEKLLGGKRRFIAPPVHDKSTLLGHELMRDLWRQAKDNALVPAERLYVIGYSLPETDMAMRTLLWESGRSAKRGERIRKIPLYLVDSNCSLADHYGKMLGDYYEVNGTYLGDDAFKRFVNDYAGD